MKPRPPGIVFGLSGKCHQRGCEADAKIEKHEGEPAYRGFCAKHLAARAISAREHPAEVIRLADFERDAITGAVYRRSPRASHLRLVG